MGIGKPCSAWVSCIFHDRSVALGLRGMLMLDAAKMTAAGVDAFTDRQMDAAVRARHHFFRGARGGGRRRPVAAAAGFTHDPIDDQKQPDPEQVFHGLSGVFR